MTAFAGMPRAVLALWVAALALRAAQPGLVYFNIDEGTSASIAAQIARGTYFPLTGMATSFGFHNPPTMFYLLAPLFFVSRNPLVAQFAFAVAGSLAVPLLWRAGRSLAGERCGLAAAAIAAFCATAAEHSRRLWGHDLIVPFAAGTAMLSLEAAERGCWKRLAGAGCLAAVAQTLHLSGALLWLAPAAAGFAPIPGRARAAAMAAGLLGLLHVPWIASDARDGFAETRMIAAILAGGRLAESTGVPVPPLACWATQLAGMGTCDMLGNVAPRSISRGAMMAFDTASILGLAAMGAGAWIVGKERRPASAAVLAPWLATPLLFGGIVKAVVPPYQLPALAFAILLAAAAAARLPGRWFPAALAAYAMANVALAAETRRAIAEFRGPAPVLAERQRAVRDILKLAGGRPFNLQQEGWAGTIEVAYNYLFYAEGASGQFENDPAKAPQHFRLSHSGARVRIR